MFIPKDSKLFCSLADYARDFGDFSGRFVETPAGVYLWHATLAAQQMVGTRLVKLEHPTGDQYVLGGTPELFRPDSGLGLSIRSGLACAYRYFSMDATAPLLPPYYDGATKLVRYRQLSFSMLVTLVAHYSYLSSRSENALSITGSLQQIVEEFRKIPELYDERLLREGMDAREVELGFTASHHIVVGATDKHSFDNVLLRAVETLAPNEIATLHAEFALASA